MVPADVTLEKTLPNSVERERAVLGAILLDEKAIFAATEVLTADDFYLEAHREIFRAMLALTEEESSIDFFTLREEMRRRNKEDPPAAWHTLPVSRTVSPGLPIRLTMPGSSGRRLLAPADPALHELMSRCYEGEERPADILERRSRRFSESRPGKSGRLRADERAGPFGVQGNRGNRAEPRTSVRDRCRLRRPQSDDRRPPQSEPHCGRGQAGAWENFLLPQHRLPCCDQRPATGRDLQPGNVRSPRS